MCRSGDSSLRSQHRRMYVCMICAHYDEGVKIKTREAWESGGGGGTDTPAAGFYDVCRHGVASRGLRVGGRKPELGYEIGPDYLDSFTSGGGSNKGVTFAPKI